MQNMYDIFYTYFHGLIHPLKTYDELAANPQKKHLSFLEAISCSWLMVVFNALIRLVFIAFALKAYFSMSESEDFIWTEGLSYSSLGGHYLLILSAIIDIFLFPIISYVFIHIWLFLLRVFASYMRLSGDIEMKSKEIISVSMSSYALYLIPFIGDFLQKFSQYTLMFMGLKNHLKMRSIDAFLILLTPFLLLIAMTTLFSFLFILAFS